jgi:hypothetical protein
MKQPFFLVLALAFTLTQCKYADISQPYSLETKQAEQKAIQVLDEAVRMQGFVVLENQPLYTYTATDDWPGFTGKIASLWPESKIRFNAKYHFNTFDGKLLFLDGKSEGTEVGLQSWTYYEQVKGENSPKKIDPEKANKKHVFGLAAFQYFNELPYRLRQAPILRYYGEKEIKGSKYDLVFATWGSEKANKEHDQYLLYISQETHLLEYAVFTIRENANFISRKFYGSIAYHNYQKVKGMQVAMEQSVFLNDGVLTTESLDDYLHRINIEDFRIGGFEESELYPFTDVAKQMDSK